MHADQVILSEEEAKKLASFIDDNIIYTTKVEHDRNF